MRTRSERAHGGVVVVLASAGRAALLQSLIQDLGRQTRRADEIVVSVPDRRSLPSDDVLQGCSVVFERRGLAAQRNAGMDAAPDADLYFFFDDDAVVHPTYIERAIAHFADDDRIVGITGTVLLDGASGSEIAANVAHSTLDAVDPGAARGSRILSRGMYGCNFAVRRLPDMDRFDDRLPLYSWLEDRDFAHRLQARGETVKVDDCLIVHLGAGSGGRFAHVRFGFAQVMNPAYMLLKQSFTVREAVRETGRRVAKNVALSVVGPTRHWRRARLKGNLIAAGMLVRGKVEPERMTEYH